MESSSKCQCYTEIYQKVGNKRNATALTSTGVIGPNFFETERGQTVTVKAHNCWEMIREFLVPALEEYQGVYLGVIPARWGHISYD